MIIEKRLPRYSHCSFRLVNRQTLDWRRIRLMRWVPSLFYYLKKPENQLNDIRFLVNLFQFFRKATVVWVTLRAQQGKYLFSCRLNAKSSLSTGLVVQWRTVSWTTIFVCATCATVNAMSESVYIRVAGVCLMPFFNNRLPFCDSQNDIWTSCSVDHMFCT